MRRVTLALAAAALLITALAVPVTARQDGGCGNGQGWVLFLADADAMLLAYPSLQRAIDEKIYTYDTLVEQIDARNKNGNDWICVKDPYVHSTTRSGGSNDQSQGFYYFVNAVDDNSSTNAQK